MSVLQTSFNKEYPLNSVHNTYFDFKIIFPGVVFLSLVVKITSRGPVIYYQKRVGRQGRLFTLYKFRTMVKNADNLPGGSVTVQNDKRLTLICKFIRKWKLDELPTLLNVLIGDMSFVGPRPDVPGYADKLTDKDRKILDMRPGITGPATLKYLNEEALLSNVDDPIKYNDEVIFPDKVRINLKYLETWSNTRLMEFIGTHTITISEFIRVNFNSSTRFTFNLFNFFNAYLLVSYTKTLCFCLTKYLVNQVPIFPPAPITVTCITIIYNQSFLIMMFTLMIAAKYLILLQSHFQAVLQIFVKN